MAILEQISNSKKQIFLLFFSYVLSSVCPVAAQDVVFNRISSPEASYFGNINDVTQDPQGYLWFVTWGRGLHRYDGYHFVTFINDPKNPGSLSGNYLNAVCADHNGIIWIGTGGTGLDRLDPKTGIFTNYRHEKQNLNSLSDNGVTAIWEDHAGTLWIGTENGLNRFDQKTKTFTRYYYKATDSTSISSNFIQVLYEDRLHTLWIGTRRQNDTSQGKGGLNRMDRKTDRFIRYQHDPKNSRSLIDNTIGAILEDSKGNFWVSTAGDGLHSMDREKGIFERHRHDPANLSKLSGPLRQKGLTQDINQFFICEDGIGALWIGASGGWITRYDPKTKKAIPYDSINKDAQAARSVSGGFVSRDGVLWITTFVGTIYRVDPFHNNIPHYTTGSIVHAIHEDDSGVLWIGTFLGEGLLRVDRAKGSIKGYLNGWITAFHEGKDDTLWIGSENGLYLFDRKREKFKLYNNNPENENSLSEGFVTAIIEDRPGLLWITTKTGLDQLNIKTGVFTHFRNNSKETDSIINNNFSALLKDRSGNLWLGTGDGDLHKFDPRTGKFKHFSCGVGIGSIVEDFENIIWVGTATGFYRSNVALDSFSRFTDPEIALTASTIVAGILQDDQKNLWVSSSAGIFQFNPARNKITVYNKNQGVEPADLTYPLMRGTKGKQGELFFGDRTGYYSFFPDQIKSNLTPPQIVISDFRIADQTVKPGKGIPLKLSLMETQEIHLTYNQNIFSFDFTGMHYSSPEDNQHLYMLQNLHNGWRKAGTEKKAYYYNVPPGKYIFRVKVSNSYGVWTEKNIAIVITPPWWSTWWFRIATLVVVAALFYVLIRWRMQELRRRLERSEKEKQFAELQQQKIELEMQALRAQMNPHFIFNSLNSINMFILENNKLQASEYLSKFSRLVRLILQHSQEAFIPLDRELEALRLYLELESLRFEQKFEYKISVSDEVDTTMVKVPPLIIQPYAENAIWHGLMHKKEKGHLEIDLYLKEKLLVCKIADDGIGRKKAEELKSKSSLTYKSMGMRITADRIAILQQQEQNNTFISVNDLVLPDGRAAGTEVLIKVPVTYD